MQTTKEEVGSVSPGVVVSQRKWDQRANQRDITPLSSF